jgi:Saxitoxin biosynthesis operon protein SxtJ
MGMSFIVGAYISSVYKQRSKLFPQHRRLHKGASMGQNFSLHENYRDAEPTEASSDRAFGCTVGTILMVIGAAKAFVAAALPPIACLIFVAGAVLLLLGIVAPSRLSTLNRLWLKVGTAIAKVVNPIILALLFFLVVTPTAFVVRIVGKRPLRLAPDKAAATYWIEREPVAGGASSMRRQF